MGRTKRPAKKKEIEIREQTGVCTACGLDHSKLGVVVEGETLRRTARASVHMLHDAPGVGGAAWAFHSQLWDAHAVALDWVEIVDSESGRVYSVDAETFRLYAVTVNMGAGMQRALRIRWWSISAPATGDELRELLEFRPEEKQQALFTMHG